MSTGFVYLRPLNVAAFRAVGPYAQSSSTAWREVFSWLNRTGLIGQIGTGYGLLLDDPRRIAPEKCRYDACVELLDDARGVVPEAFNVRRLPGGAYARQRHVGGVVGLSDTISKMRNDWVPNLGVIVDTRRPVIEIFLDNPDSVPLQRQRVDVCMPVTAVDIAGRSAA